MNDCEEIPYTYGMSGGDIMMLGKPVNNIHLSTSPVKIEECDIFPMSSNLPDTGMDWTMNNSDNLQDVFPPMVQDLGDTTDIDELLSGPYSPFKQDHVSLLDINTTVPPSSGGNGDSTYLPYSFNATTYSNTGCGNLKEMLVEHSNLEHKLMKTDQCSAFANDMGHSFLDDMVVGSDSFSLDDLLQPKYEVTTTPMDALDSISRTVDSSPSHSSCNSDSSDSGVSADESVISNAVALDQRLSPLPEYTNTPDYSFSPSSLNTPLRSPAFSGSSSGYCSSSPSSSPGDSPPSNSATINGLDNCAEVPASPPAAAGASCNGSDRLRFPAAVATTVTTTSGGTPQLLNTSNSVQTTTGPPQFYLQKRSNINNKCVANNSINNRTLTKTISKQPIVNLLTQRTCNVVTNNTRLLTTVNSKIIHTTLSNRTTSNNNTNNVVTTKLVHKSSAPPSLVTLSGVNKTAAIIKSPSVINVSRKAINTTTSSNNVFTTSNIHIQKATDSTLSSTTGNGKVYKTVTVSNNLSRVTMPNGQQLIISPRSTVCNLTGSNLLKTSQDGSVFIPINTKDIDKMHHIKFIHNSNSNITSSPTFVRKTNGVHTFVSGANRIRQTATAGLATSISSPALRNGNTSILKSLCIPVGKTMQSVKDGFASLVAIPKEEILDSDDETAELQKTNQPLCLSDEEKKLAMKEKIKFPSHYPLNKMQERELKRIKRKIRNKISAQDSRKRKKEYMDKLEDRVSASSQENDRLKGQLAALEETNKKLAEQLKKCHAMMSAQAGPSVTHSSNHSHHHSNGHNTRQQHPSSLVLMAFLFIAVVVYPSAIMQGKTPSELLTAVSHKMPSGGNTRSLLEAATSKLSVCDMEDDMELDSKPIIAALNDHDYTPPAKRVRYDRRDNHDNYCMLPIDDQLPPLPHKKKPADDGGVDGQPDDPPILKRSTKPDDAAPPIVKFEPDLATGIFSQETIDTFISQFKNSNNWTEPGGEKHVDFDSLSQAVVVELTTAGTKLLREDIELE